MAPNIASPKARETHRGSKHCFAENEREGAGPKDASPMKGGGRRGSEGTSPRTVEMDRGHKGASPSTGETNREHKGASREKE